MFQPRCIRRPTGGHQLIGLRIALGGVGAEHAVVCVIVEQAERDLVERAWTAWICVRTSMQ